VLGHLVGTKAPPPHPDGGPLSEARDRARSHMQEGCALARQLYVVQCWAASVGKANTEIGGAPEGPAARGLRVARPHGATDTMREIPRDPCSTWYYLNQSMLYLAKCV
jgi:hypothetical protein